MRKSELKYGGRGLRTVVILTDDRTHANSQTQADALKLYFSAHEYLSRKGQRTHSELLSIILQRYILLNFQMEEIASNL